MGHLAREKSPLDQWKEAQFKQGHGATLNPSSTNLGPPEEEEEDEEEDFSFCRSPKAAWKGGPALARQRLLDALVSRATAVTGTSRR